MAIACAGTAHAQSAGSFIFSTGWFHLAPQDRSSEIQLVSRGGSPINQSIPNTGSAVDSSDTIGVTGTYFVTDNIAVEGVFGIPPKFRPQRRRRACGIRQARLRAAMEPRTAAQVLLPSGTNTLSSVPRHRGEPRVVLRCGNHQWPVSRQSIARRTDDRRHPVEVGAGLQWRFSFQVTDHWYAGLSISYLPLKTTATLTSNSATSDRQTDVGKQGGYHIGSRSSLTSTSAIVSEPEPTDPLPGLRASGRRASEARGRTASPAHRIATRKPTGGALPDGSLTSSRLFAPPNYPALARYPDARIQLHSKTITHESAISFPQKMFCTTGSCLPGRAPVRRRFCCIQDRKFRFRPGNDGKVGAGIRFA